MRTGSASLYWWEVRWGWIRNLVTAQPEPSGSIAERCWCSFQEDRIADVLLTNGDFVYSPCMF